jgi:hypothetical protein
MGYLIFRSADSNVVVLEKDSTLSAIPPERKAGCFVFPGDNNRDLWQPYLVVILLETSKVVSLQQGINNLYALSNYISDAVQSCLCVPAPSFSHSIVCCSLISLR